MEEANSKLLIYPENQFASNIPLRKSPSSLTSNHPPSKLHPVIASNGLKSSKNQPSVAKLNSQQSARAPLESKAAKGIPVKMNEGQFQQHPLRYAVSNNVPQQISKQAINFPLRQPPG